MSDFGDYLQSQAATDAGASFSSNAPRPYVSGVATNVLPGAVNVGTATRSVDRELLGLHGKSSAGTEVVPTTASVQQAALSLYRLSHDDIQALQDQLIAAGYMSRRDIAVPGVADSATAKAYGDLLQDTSAYNAAGNQMTINELLAQRGQARAAAHLGDTGGASGRSGMVQSTSNPLDIAATARDVAVNDLGRRLTPKQLDTFVKLYHGIESRKNAQAVAAVPTVEAGGNVTSVDAPSATAAADNYVRTNFAAEAGAHDMAGQFSNFLDIIKGI